MKQKPASSFRSVESFLPSNLLAAVSAIGLCVFGAGAAFAQAGGAPAQASDAQEPEQETILVTGSRYVPNVGDNVTRLPLSLKDTPQAIGFVTRELIQDVGAIRVEDVVERVSGVQRGQNFGGIYRGAIIRGFDLDNTVSFKEDGFVFQNQIDLDLANIERIEVLKGPSSIGFGVGVPGGLINRVTKRPLAEQAYVFTADVDSFGTARLAADLGGPLTSNGRIRYRLNTVYEDRKTHLDFSGNQRFNISPVVEADVGEKTLVRVSSTYQRDRGQPDEGQSLLDTGEFPDISVSRAGSTQDSLFEVDFVSFSGNVQHKFSSNLSMNFRYDWRRWTRNIVNGYTYQSGPLQIVDDPDFAGTENAITNVLWNRDRNTTTTQNLDANITGNFEIFGQKQEIVVGIERVSNKRRYTEVYQYGPVIDLFDEASFYRQRIPREFFDKFDFDQGFNLTYTNVYTNVVLRFTESLTMLLSGNYSLVKGEQVDGTVQQDFRDFAPRIGLVYALTDQINAYVSYSEGFFGNDGRDRNFNFLPPSAGTQWEAGAKASFADGRFFLSGAIFQIDRTNLAETDLECRPGGGAIVPCDNINAQRLVGSRRHRGFELDAVGSPLAGLNLIASLAFVDATTIQTNNIDLIGTRAPNVARWTGSFFGSYEVQSGPWKGFGFGGGPVYLGDRLADEGRDIVPTRTIEGYTRWDALLFYRGSETVSVNLNINNITNNTSAVANTRRINFFNYRQQPRTVNLSVSKRF